ncbi:acriflavine sensitivity control protein acr-2 [Podospora appendiculata]|uniref:Acriflavine sensitivity control protein acr-2 n=1 Tax=Podospora appendiculata TaxID=314037 RepID=A0AAE0WZ76_9PEZI|nr:acriflavine sensitivity control protein acr-2 [Podospora appendiculata]
MAGTGPQSKACYNCRRRRLRCDKSRPSCYKCSSNGEECLGYGLVLRWANAPATRGKLASRAHTQHHQGHHHHHGQQLLVRGSRGAGSDPDPDPDPDPDDRDPASALSPAASTSGTAAAFQHTCISRSSSSSSSSSSSPPHHVNICISPSLLDPFLNGASEQSRYYIYHFANTVCRDLVSIDQHDRNPFRSILPLISKFGYLQEIVIATSAMHLATLHRYMGRRPAGELVDALTAKSRAIRLLQAAISNATLTSQAVILATIVFFVNLDLIDSGKGGWKAHIEAAEMLISSLQKVDGHLLDPSVAPLADAIAADCVTYRILGSTISGVGFLTGSTMRHGIGIDVFTVLQRAEAYSYHCCPPLILQLILSTSRLCSPESSLDNNDRIAATASLLQQARTFNVREWVNNIRGLSSHDDLVAREHLASAFRAAACLYMLLVLPDGSSDTHDTSLLSPQTADELVLEVLGHLSRIPDDHVLLKGTSWPTFIAGAHTDDRVWRAWCLSRLREVWNKNPWICPWGYVHTAIQMLQDVWDAKATAAPDGGTKMNWLQELRTLRGNCLIV